MIPVRRLPQLVVFACAWLWSATASAQETKIRMDIVGFDADQKNMLVKLDDVNTGLALRLYDVESGAPAKKSQLVQYQRQDGPKTVKEARKRYKTADPGIEDTIYPLDPKDETKTLSIFGLMAAKDRFVIAVTDKQKLGKLKDVKLKVDEETKTLAKANLKTVFWTTDRKTMVAVITQKLETAGFTSETDEFHAIRFKPDGIQWVEPEPPPQEKDDKPKEEKKKGWWPF
jgi:hypothetical protein